MSLDPNRLIPVLFVIFFAIGLHEYAHCKVADMAGDPTPGIYGRVTLNLFKHFEPIGTIMIILTSMTGIGIGWGRPAPMDPRKMANPRWDFFAAVLAGPLSNLFQAIVYGAILRFGGDAVFSDRLIGAILVLGVAINLSLCVFNLIPLGPLDGHWLIGQLMPEKPRYYYYKFNAGPGTLILIGGILLGQILSQRGGPDLLAFLDVPVVRGYHLITGLDLGQSLYQIFGFG